MREVREQLEILWKTIEVANHPVTPNETADLLPLDQQQEAIRAKTHPQSPYARATRAVLIQAGWGELCLSPEEGDEI